MKALSILQPYAWLIVHGHKDIENRSWYTPFRGRFLVHAGKRYSCDEHADYAEGMLEDFGIVLPSYEVIPRGGIVGEADLVDCVKRHSSRWKVDDSWGFVLREARPLPATAFRGQLGFFDVPDFDAALPGALL